MFHVDGESYQIEFYQRITFSKTIDPASSIKFLLLMKRRVEQFLLSKSILVTVTYVDINYS